jgi:prevent-host-death family protein
MIVKSTEIKNNFGKYLKLLHEENIIITRNGTPVARIEKYSEFDDTPKVTENSTAYNYDGRRMTYEEFIEFYENTEDRYEYIDGEVYLLASPRVTHQQVLGNLHILLHAWFRDKKCRPYLSPFDVTLKKGKNNMNVVQPDILVVCDSDNRNEKDKYTGVPTLVVEILSQSTRRKDVIKKLDLYMQSGVREYWIVDYFNREVIVYTFDDRDIKNMKSFVKDDILMSFIFEGLSLKLPEIFE